MFLNVLQNDCEVVYNQSMKRFFLLLLLATVAVIGIYPPLRHTVNNAMLSSACNTPIVYTLRSVDSRFNLENAQVKSDIEGATAVWSRAEGKQLFVAGSGNTVLKVNFVYDQRQALDSQIQDLHTQLGEKNSTIKQQMDAYYAQVSQFKEKLAQLNNEIDAWNKKGGAPPDIYNSLTDRQKALQAEADTLNAMARQLNISTGDYNTQVSVLNNDVNQFNSALAQKPEEGLYDPVDNSITIYFATDKTELVHTLAHEFGHALGMQHVSDQNGIMYPYTTKSLVPSPADLQELQYVCRKQYIFVFWINDFAYWLHNILIKFQK